MSTQFQLRYLEFFIMAIEKENIFKDAAIFRSRPKGSSSLGVPLEHLVYTLLECSQQQFILSVISPSSFTKVPEMSHIDFLSSIWIKL